VGQDHWERFEGNVEDHFRIGIQMHSKYARLFAPFYSADILVASPLGLRMIVKSETDKARETDFLSSIEVLLVHRHLSLSLYLHPCLHL
jgi:U3 small nucleolar RNA-associated protein 25